MTDDATFPHGPLSGRTIALCVTGSIAAYKAVELARLLLKRGARVVPVMTTSASRFVGPVTLAGITGEPVATDMWDPSLPGETHVRIAEKADLVAVVPATADVLARMAQGRADDLVTALVLCARGPVVVAPAMHPRMWDHPATQQNVSQLAAQRRVQLVGPVSGEVASGDVGHGRMAEPEAIVAAITTALSPRAEHERRHQVVGPVSGEVASGDVGHGRMAEPEAIVAAITTALSPRDLAGLRVVVTAGPTLEDLDPVRFLGNRSSGKMGFAVAERAAARGADVTLVAGPVSLPTPHGVRRVDVRGAVAMRQALWQAMGLDLSKADALVMAAAVADHRPAEPSASKIKKSDERFSIDFVRNPDLLAEVGAARVGKRPVLVGFAVETERGQALVAYARRKLGEKKVDLVVANDAGDSFGREDNRATLVTAAEATALPTMTKTSLADVLLDRVRELGRK